MMSDACLPAGRNLYIIESRCLVYCAKIGALIFHYSYESDLSTYSTPKITHLSNWMWGKATLFLTDSKERRSETVCSNRPNLSFFQRSIASSPYSYLFAVNIQKALF